MTILWRCSPCVIAAESWVDTTWASPSTQNTVGNQLSASRDAGKCRETTWCCLWFSQFAESWVDTTGASQITENAVRSQLSASRGGRASSMKISYAESPTEPQPDLSVAPDSVLVTVPPRTAEEGR